MYILQRSLHIVGNPTLFFFSCVTYMCVIFDEFYSVLMLEYLLNEFFSYLCVVDDEAISKCAQ